MTGTENKFSPYYNKFQEVSETLKVQSWFTEDWEVIVAYYGEGAHPSPGFTLQKKNWFNDNGAGIHFESWIGNADIKRRAIPIAMHFETNYERSGIRRGAFHAYILDHGKDVIENLDGYKLSPKSMQLLINRAPFTNETLVNVMAQEYGKLQQLSSVIDAAIKATRER